MSIADWMIVEKCIMSWSIVSVIVIFEKFLGMLFSMWDANFFQFVTLFIPGGSDLFGKFLIESWTWL